MLAARDHEVRTFADGHRPPSKFEKLRGHAGPGPSTDEMMAILRGDD